MSVFLRFLKYTTLVWAGLSADLSRAEPPYQIPSDAALLGMKLSSSGDQIALASGSVDGAYARLSIAPISPNGVYINVPLATGIVPYTPVFGVDDKSIVYVGRCRMDVVSCAPEQDGWNIYRYAFENGKTEQLTKADTQLVRWRPAVCLRLFCRVHTVLR